MTTDEIQRLNDTINALRLQLDTKLNASAGYDIWMLLSTFNIILMQLGFSMVETGIVAAHHTLEVLMKNIVDSCFGTMAFYLCGYAVMTNNVDNIASIPANEMTSWIWSCSFATTTATILSGGVLSRVQFRAYFAYSILSSGFIYPMAAHWCWSGWLSNAGFLDFAGGGPVHIVGGVSALVGAISLGPRVGRFPKHGEVNRVKPASDAMLVLGTFVLWFGWYFFNASSANSVLLNGMKQSRMAAINTLLASSAGGIGGFLWSFASTKFLVAELCFIGNSILIALVAITPGCAFVSHNNAVLIGFLSVPIYSICSDGLLKFRIDDPAEASCVHLGGGVFGLLMLGLLHTTQGLFTTGKIDFFLIELLGAVVCVVWSGCWSIFCWIILGFASPHTLKLKESRWKTSAVEQLTGFSFKVDSFYGETELTKSAISLHARTMEAKKKVMDELATRKVMEMESKGLPVNPSQKYSSKILPGQIFHANDA